VDGSVKAAGLSGYVAQCSDRNEAYIQLEGQAPGHTPTATTSTILVYNYKYESWSRWLFPYSPSGRGLAAANTGTYKNDMLVACNETDTAPTPDVNRTLSLDLTIGGTRDSVSSIFVETKWLSYPNRWTVVDNRSIFLDAYANGVTGTITVNWRQRYDFDDTAQETKTGTVTVTPSAYYPDNGLLLERQWERSNGRAFKTAFYTTSNIALHTMAAAVRPGSDEPQTASNRRL
jgi:hypothetical protein